MAQARQSCVPPVKPTRPDAKFRNTAWPPPQRALPARARSQAPGVTSSPLYQSATVTTPKETVEPPSPAQVTGTR